MKRTAQTQKILEYLKAGHGITSLEAFQKFGITRLSGRIYDLRKCGYKIVKMREESENTRYVRYWL